MVDKDSVLDMAIAGQSIRAIARHHSCSQAVVRTLLDECAAEQLKPSARAAMVMLELNRLEKLESVFLKDAVANLNYQSAVVAIKASTRKAQLAGLDQPQTVHLNVTNAAEQPDETSTQRMLKALQELKLSDPHYKEREEFNEMLRQRDAAAARRQIEGDGKGE